MGRRWDGRHNCTRRGHFFVPIVLAASAEVFVTFLPRTFVSFTWALSACVPHSVPQKKRSRQRSQSLFVPTQCTRSGIFFIIVLLKFKGIILNIFRDGCYRNVAFYKEGPHNRTLPANCRAQLRLSVNGLCPDRLLKDCVCGLWPLNMGSIFHG